MNARFHSKIRIDPQTGCHVWTGSIDPHGYGRIMINRKLRLAHRLGWELANGPIPSGLNILHRCDNRPCVNPEHLFLGTHQDNTADMVAKGRSRNIPRNGVPRRSWLRSGKEEAFFDEGEYLAILSTLGLTPHSSVTAKVLGEKLREVQRYAAGRQLSRKAIVRLLRLWHRRFI